MSPTYSNIKLTSRDGDLSVVVYLPIGVRGRGARDEESFYYSSRFDQGSMIGSITRKKRRSSSAASDHETPTDHVLYGTDMWRLPHNSHWPESGVGLASEFGVGDDGALCDFRCGWPAAVGVTNGLLGYQEAGSGGSFLKIGVGELIKGTCPACDSTDDYRFNSPYLFAKQPVWTMTRASDDRNAAVRLEHQAVLRNHGYHLIKEIALTNNVLTVKTTLQNLGDAPFSTVWYSHNFFTCDQVAVGPGYSLDFDIKGESVHPVYEEPSTWSWSTPLKDYGRVKLFPNSVHLEMTRTLDPGTRIKAEFADDHVTTGGFTLSACETGLESSIVSPDFARDGSKPISMYAYNLYIERGTFSPEPQLLISNLMPGQSVSWTQVVVVHDNGFETSKVVPVPVAAEVRPWWTLRGIVGVAAQQQQSLQDFSVSYRMEELVAIAGILTACCLLIVLLQSTRTRYRRRNYDELS